ncbi:MAG: ABC transporter permease [Oligoflexus sp.]
MTRQAAWRRLLQNKAAWLPLTILASVFLLALFAPWISPYSPYEMAPDRLLEAPSWSHWAGTDRFGRDVISRLIFGARIALQVAFSAVCLALILGSILGMVAAYFGGKIDWFLARSMDVLLSLPEVLLALLAIAVLGPSQRNLVIAIAIVYTPLFARIARGATLSARQETYVEASILLGGSAIYNMGRHILPNISGPLLVQCSLSLAFAVLAEAALSFLGFGVEPDVPSWGMMLKSGKDWMEEAWWLASFPGVILTALVFSFHQLGEQLQKLIQATNTH